MLRYIDNLTVEFKKDISNIEIRGIDVILDTIGREKIGGLPKSDGYGLAYTSSSSYAMYNVTENVKLHHKIANVPPLKVSHICITANEMLILVAEDANENYYYFEIECTDFW
jgi:hypothetical protein